jgi:DNA-binding response OmpR family regulator
VATTKILLVNDDELALITLLDILEQGGFSVTCATNVLQALEHICSVRYDALLTNLHLSRAKDGLLIVNELRRANPSAVILLLSAVPQLETATQAILLQADDIVGRPTDTASLIDVLTHRIASGPARSREIECVGEILDRTTEVAIAEWYSRVEKESLLMSIPMSCEHRCGHLPQLFHDLVVRLRTSAPDCNKESLSIHAALHGINRRKAAYTAAMLVDESRLLQVSIFRTLHNNRSNLDFGRLLIGIATIADEVDSQLRQAIESFHTSSGRNQRPVGQPRAKFNELSSVGIARCGKRRFAP